MERRPTMRDVASRCGLSVSSVSYVLSGRADKPLSSETRERVLRAAAELGYTRNAAAAALRRGHSSVVLMVLDGTLVGEVSAQTIEHLTAGVHDLGYTAVSHRLVSESELVEVVGTLQPFAVMLLCFVSADSHRRISNLGVKVTGLPPAQGDPVDEDRPWERSIGAAQARHLIDHGHSRIAYLMPEPGSARWPVAKCRLAGAEEACARAGLKLARGLEVPLDRVAIALALRPLRASGITAICASDDRMGLAVLAAAHDQGWMVPGDIAIIGADDLPEAALSVPPLTTVKLSDAHDRQAARDWLQSAVDPERPQDIASALPPVLPVLRAST